MRPTFHCSLAVWITFNCCSKYSRIIVNWFTVFYWNFCIVLYTARDVNRTVRLQWKVDTIKNCIYLQCTWIFHDSIVKTQAHENINAPTKTISTHYVTLHNKDKVEFEFQLSTIFNEVNSKLSLIESEILVKIACRRGR